MTVDEIYDRLRMNELGSSGAESEQAEESVSEPEHLTDGEMYDRLLMNELGSSEAEPVLAEVSEPMDAELEDTQPERPSGLARYRTAALVGAGGLACAAVGGLLGGVGGYFNISPAEAHPVASAAQDLPLATAADQAGNGGSTSASVQAHGSTSQGSTSLSGLGGSLTQGIAPFISLLSDPSSNLPVGSGTGWALPAAGRARALRPARAAAAAAASGAAAPRAGSLRSPAWPPTSPGRSTT